MKGMNQALFLTLDGNCDFQRKVVAVAFCLLC